MSPQSYDVHALRNQMTARDKAVAMEKPFDEGVKFIAERYATSTDSATAFITWLKGLYTDGAGKRNPKEVLHSKFDTIEGEWVYVADEDSKSGTQGGKG